MSATLTAPTTAPTSASLHTKGASASSAKTLVNDETASSSRTATPDPHSHVQHHHHDQGLKCPVTGQQHGFCPAQKTDKRSPCPALNTLANHGYLPRNGQHIHAGQLVSALREGYNLSWALATFLTIGALLILGQYRCISLSDISRHNLIEHDASIVHADAKAGSEYAPTRVVRKLVENMLSKVGHDRPNRITLDDVAHLRVAREAQTHVLDFGHAEIARGELTIALGVIGGAKAEEEGADINAFKDWLVEERFPDNWKPEHVQGFWKTVFMTRKVDRKMHELRAAKPAPKSYGSTATAKL